MTTLIYSPRHHAIYADTRQTTIDTETGKIVRQRDVCKAVDMDGLVWVGDTRYHVVKAATCGSVSACERMIDIVNNNGSRQGSLMPRPRYSEYEEYSLLLLTDTGECIEIDERLRPRLISSTYALGSGSGKLPLNVFGMVAPKLSVQMAACLDVYTGGYVECHMASHTVRLSAARTMWSDILSYSAIAATVAVVIPVAIVCAPMILKRYLKWRFA